jgi:hypothetical protein
MNPESSKLQQRQHQVEQATESQLEQQAPGAQEFNSVEDMMRFDAERTPAPERIADRLKQSIAAEPPPALSWWRRLFGKKA